MTNAFYNHVSANPANQTRGNSSTMRAEFDAIVAGFDGVDALNNEVIAARQGQASLLANMALKAPAASPTFTGTPSAPTASPGTATTQLATTAFMMAAIATVNAQTALTLSIDSASSVAVTAGQHKVCTNAAAVTATLPAAPTANQRCRVTFTNSLFSNVIDPGSEKVFGVSGTRSVNALHATVEFTYVNSSIGWVY
jgi:hypothetical protein